VRVSPSSTLAELHIKNKGLLIKWILWQRMALCEYLYPRKFCTEVPCLVDSQHLYNKLKYPTRSCSADTQTNSRTNRTTLASYNRIITGPMGVGWRQTVVKERDKEYRHIFHFSTQFHVDNWIFGMKKSSGNFMLSTNYLCTKKQMNICILVLWVEEKYGGISKSFRTKLITK